MCPLVRSLTRKDHDMFGPPPERDGSSRSVCQQPLSIDGSTLVRWRYLLTIGMEKKHVEAQTPRDADTDARIWSHAIRLRRGRWPASAWRVGQRQLILRAGASLRLAVRILRIRSWKRGTYSTSGQGPLIALEAHWAGSGTMNGRWMLLARHKVSHLDEDLS